jgi:hypothetical protein
MCGRKQHKKIAQDAVLHTRHKTAAVKLQPFGIVPGDSLHELLYARNSYRNTTIAFQAV